jgi:ankyrin repeat protein
VVKALLAAGGDVEQIDASGLGTWLMHAAWEGHLDVVRVLVAGGAVVDRKLQGRTALEAALENDHIEVAEYLKKRGADWVMLTLLYACQRGDLDEVKKAVAAGARIDRGYGAFKDTPLMRAASKGRIGVVTFLLKHGANPRVQVEGRNALWHAAATGRNVEVIDALVEAGANVNDDCDGCTALMAAAQFAPFPVVQRLVELGADVAATDRTGTDAALDYARQGKNAEVVSYLERFGAKSARDPVRDLARAIAREFGGRLVPVFDGFLIKSKLSGFSCEYRVRGSQATVEISDLEITDKDFRAGESAWLIVGPKPERNRGPCRPVARARQFAGAPVYRSTDRGCIAEEAVVRFCRRHRRAFDRLRLSGADEVWMGDSYAQFTWKQSAAIPGVRLRAFGSLVRGIARQIKPSSSRDVAD